MNIYLERFHAFTGTRLSIATMCRSILRVGFMYKKARLTHYFSFVWSRTKFAVTPPYTKIISLKIPSLPVYAGIWNGWLPNVLSFFFCFSELQLRVIAKQRSEFLRATYCRFMADYTTTNVIAVLFSSFGSPRHVADTIYGFLKQMRYS